MIKDFFCNTITILSRQEIVRYEGGIPKKSYQQEAKQIVCRVGHLNAKDLQFLSKTAEVSIETRKLFTDAKCPLKLKDKLLREGQEYQVISAYTPQNQTGAHHKKYFIQRVQS